MAAIIKTDQLWLDQTTSSTVGAPALIFGADSLSGLYRIGTNNIGLTINGTKLLDLSSATFAVTGAGTFSTTLGVTGLATVGAGGTGSLTADLTINGSNASGYGSTLTFKQNSVINGQLGQIGAILGTSSQEMGYFSRTGHQWLINNTTTIGMTLASTGAVTIPGNVNIGGTEVRLTSNAGGQIIGYTGAAYRSITYDALSHIFQSSGASVATVASTGLSITGTLGVTGVVSAPILRSTSPDPDDVSVATSTATTIFSASTYLIGRNGMLFSVMDDATIFGVGLVLKNSNGSLVVTTIFSQGSGFALSISSTNVQFTQTVGTTRTIKTRMWPSFSV